jgi:hypothetical protein
MKGGLNTAFLIAKFFDTRYLAEDGSNIWAKVYSGSLDGARCPSSHCSASHCCSWG